MSDLEQAKKHFFAALDFIDASDFRNAELQLRAALPFSPGSVSILTNLAVVLLRQDKRSEAREFAEQATAAGSDNVEAMLVLADCYVRDDDKSAQALAILEKVIALDPAIADAHNNLGLVLRKLGRLDEALESLDRAIAIEPGLADAHANRGTVLRAFKRYDEAFAAYDKALALKPDLVEAWLGRGNTFAALLRHDEAGAAYRRALTHNPEMVAALEALAVLRLSEGNVADALGLARRAFKAKETPETKALVVSCLSSPLFNPSLVNTDLGDLRDLLLRALSEPWVRQSELAPACASLLMHDATISNGTARATKAWPKLLPLQKLLGPPGLAKVAEDRLFRTLLESAPVSTAALERFATTLRFNLVAAARSGAAVTEPVLGLYCALARQCYINNYVFAVSEAETEQVRALRGEVVAALSSAADIASLPLVALAAFAPLHTLPGAQALLAQSWPDAVAAVMEQQVRASLEEQRLRASMPALTPIGAGVSAQVREQYEENPTRNGSSRRPHVLRQRSTRSCATRSRTRHSSSSAKKTRSTSWCPAVAPASIRSTPYPGSRPGTCWPSTSA